MTITGLFFLIVCIPPFKTSNSQQVRYLKEFFENEDNFYHCDNNEILKRKGNND